MIYKEKVYFNKFIYTILFCITLIVSYFCIANIGNSNSEITWQSQAQYDYNTKVEVDDNGVINTIYEVTTPEQLAGVFAQSELTYADDHEDIADSSNKIFRLMNDIDLSGKSWVPSTLSSDYTFDGNYFTILDLTISRSEQCVGFISTNNGTIQNLFFKNTTVTNNYTSSSTWIATGGVCGYNNGTIKNVTVLSGNIKGPTYQGNNDRQTGGIAGGNGGTIVNCINYATVGRTKFAGGIVGLSNTGTISRCANYGTISCGRNIYPRAGGIVGEITDKGTTLQLCVNNGNIAVGQTDNTNPNTYICAEDTRIGGIVGMTYESITQCANYGSVSSGTFNVAGYNHDHKTSYVGGIAGYSNAQITNCYNMGNITADAEVVTKTENTGVKTYNEFEVHHHYNFAMGVDSLYYTRQTVNKTTETENAYAGGIAGYGTSVTYSYSVGNITGGYSYESYTINHTLKAEKVANILGIPSGIKSSDTWSLNQTVYRYTSAYCKAIANGATVSYCYYYGELKDNRSGSDGGYSDGAVFVSPGAIVGNWLITYNFAYGTNASQSIQKSLSEIHNANGRNSDATVYFTASASNGTFKYVVKVDSGYPDSANNEKDVNNNVTILNFTISNLTEKATSKTESEIKNLNMGSAWSKNSNINNGFPYLKDLYW